jgi:predicted nuclease with RNAse H fold
LHQRTTESATGQTVGIDLAASPEYGAKRYGRVGLAALDARLRVVELAAGPFTDDNIAAFAERHRPAVVAIDSPLSLPADGILRPVDRELIRRRLRPYPPLLPSMAAMTRRGCALRAALSERGCDVIEVFPGAAQDVLGIPRKKAGLYELAAGLQRLGIAGLPAKPDGDALDAVTAAYVAQLYVRGRCEAIGPADDVQVWLPISTRTAR